MSTIQHAYTSSLPLLTGFLRFVVCRCFQRDSAFLKILAAAKATNQKIAETSSQHANLVVDYRATGEYSPAFGFVVVREAPYSLALRLTTILIQVLSVHLYGLCACMCVFVSVGVLVDQSPPFS